MSTIYRRRISHITTNPKANAERKVRRTNRNIDAANKLLTKLFADELGITKRAHKERTYPKAKIVKTKATITTIATKHPAKTQELGYKPVSLSIPAPIATRAARRPENIGTIDKTTITTKRIVRKVVTTVSTEATKLIAKATELDINAIKVIRNAQVFRAMCMNTEVAKYFAQHRVEQKLTEAKALRKQARELIAKAKATKVVTYVTETIKMVKTIKVEPTSWVLTLLDITPASTKKATSTKLNLQLFANTTETNIVDSAFHSSIHCFCVVCVIVLWSSRMEFLITFFMISFLEENICANSCVFKFSIVFNSSCSNINVNSSNCSIFMLD